MKKAVMASVVMFVLGGCTPQPSENYFAEIGKSCKTKYGIIEPYLHDIPHPNSEKSIECMRSRVMDGYKKNELSLEQANHLNKMFDYNALLIEKRKKGEISRAESLVMLDEWEQKQQQSTPSVQSHPQYQKMSLGEALTQTLQQIQPDIDRYNMSKQGINPYTGVPYGNEGNERQSFHCNSQNIGGGVISTNCY